MSAVQVGPDTRPLELRLRQARTRLWWQRSIRMLVRAAGLSFGVVLLAGLLSGWQAPREFRDMAWILVPVPVVAGILASLLSRPSEADAARALDDRLGLAQQIGTAQELLSRNARGELVSLQIARAVSTADAAQVSLAFPLLPVAEARTTSLAGSIAGLVFLLVSLGITFPNPLDAIKLPMLGGSQVASVRQDVLGARSAKEPLRPRSAALDPVQRILDDLRRGSSQGNSLSAMAVGAALSAASGELNRLARDSRTTQESLENLANEMRGTAAGREAAESMRHGDYAQAAARLKELGRQSDQLSDRAKMELAEALNRAAQGSQGSPDLSRREAAASQAFQKGNYGSIVESMDQLSRSVQRAADQTVSQQELAESWQQLEELASQLGSPLQQGANQQNGVSPPVAQASQRAEEKSGQMAQGTQSASEAGGKDAGAQVDEAPGAGLPNGGQGQPGTEAGGPALGDPKAREGSGQELVDIAGKATDRFTGDSATGGNPPTVLREGSADAGSSEPQQTDTGPISVPAEHVYVPGDRRPVVRDYFSNESRGQ